MADDPPRCSCFSSSVKPDPVVEVDVSASAWDPDPPLLSRWCFAPEGISPLTYTAYSLSTSKPSSSSLWIVEAFVSLLTAIRPGMMEGSAESG